MDILHHYIYFYFSDHLRHFRGDQPRNWTQVHIFSRSTTVHKFAFEYFLERSSQWEYIEAYSLDYFYSSFLQAQQTSDSKLNSLHANTFRKWSTGLKGQTSKYLWTLDTINTGKWVYSIFKGLVSHNLRERGLTLRHLEGRILYFVNLKLQGAHPRVSVGSSSGKSEHAPPMGGQAR